jgi:peptidyl-prolyl cis-trans isomerase SurA
MKHFALSIALLLGAAPLPAQKKLAPADQPLFSVDRTPVTIGEFTYLYKKNHQNKPEEFKEQNIRDYLDLFVVFKLKVAEARARGIDTSQAFIKEFNSYRDELKKPFVASQDELAVLVKEAYERMKEEVKASHILVNLKPEASPADTLAAFNKIVEARKRIIAGEDFGTVAMQVSEDPTVKENRGSLGYFTGLQMVYPFEDAAFKLKPQEVSQPVRTRFGYHVIKLFERRPASGEVEVSHILLTGKTDKVRDKAFAIYDQIKGGRKWEDVCKEYSEDAGTRDKGGRLPVFSIGALPNVPEFENTAFSLQPGEISDPFSSGMGWHIIKLERKIPVPSFPELEPTLRRRIAGDERLKLSKATQLNRRKKEAGFVENTATVSALEARADTTLQRGRWKFANETSMNDQTLFTIGGQPATVKAFLSYVKAHQRNSMLAPNAYFRQLLDEFSEARLNDAEDLKLQRENPDYRNLLNEYREGIMLFSVMEEEVWNKASADTAGQRAHYEQHKDQYKAGERLYARIFSTTDSLAHQEVSEKITRGDSITAQLAKKLRSSGTFRGYEKGENKAIDQVPWAVGVHRTEADGMYYLVEVERLLPPGIKNYNDVRANVISDYQEQLEKSWVSGLRRKYKVKMNKKAIKAMIGELEIRS